MVFVPVVNFHAPLVDTQFMGEDCITAAAACAWNMVKADPVPSLIDTTPTDAAEVVQ